MYHPRLIGRHWDAGYRYGSLIYKKGIRIEQYFRLSKERKDFGIACIELCERVFPDVLEEIRGLADGTRLRYEDFAAFIFCMYCFEFQNWCTCFTCKDEDNIIFGRNSDFATSIQDQYESAFYRLEGGYAFIGNSTAMVQMEDGINEHGLAIGLTFINLKVVRPGLNAGIILRYILEKCKTVKEALASLSKMPIASAQTFIMVDRSGDMAVVECNCEKTVFMRRKKNENFMVTANRFVSAEMQQYQDDVEDFRSRDRYETAYSVLKAGNDYSVKLAQDILSGKYGFMCQYDRSRGFDTVWSTVYDLKHNKIYRAEGNPSKAKYKIDQRLSF